MTKQAQDTKRPKIRLYVPEDFSAGHHLILNPGQSHYLAHVMRVETSDSIAVFNGKQGEWLAAVSAIQKKSVTLHLSKPLAPQKNSPDMWLAFAPIRNKTELVVEKAVELGVSALLPVFTGRAVVKSINHEKLVAHAIEAAEQCERHDVPTISEHKDLSGLLGSWPKDRTLFYGDENGGGDVLKNLLPQLKSGKYGLLIGPEGGFSDDEHHMLKAAGFAKAISLGPRILRADTAAVAALACLQAWVGDWEEQPHYKSAS